MKSHLPKLKSHLPKQETRSFEEETSYGQRRKVRTVWSNRNPIGLSCRTKLWFCKRNPTEFSSEVFSFFTSGLLNLISHYWYFRKFTCQNIKIRKANFPNQECHLQNQINFFTLLMCWWKAITQIGNKPVKRLSSRLPSHTYQCDIAFRIIHKQF